MVLLFFALMAFTIVSAAADQYPLSEAAVIDLINSVQHSWTAGRNFPEGTPLGFLEKLNGVIHDGSRNALPVIRHDILRMPIMMPINFDSREEWPRCLSLNEIRNQRACGSCWAFGAVEVMTDRYCIRSKGQKNFHFSAEDLLACCESGGCNGGRPVSAWLHFFNRGIVSGGNYLLEEGCRPYTVPPRCAPGLMYCTVEDHVPTPACVQRCQEGYNLTTYSQDKKYGERPYSILNNEVNIMAELLLNGPVQANFETFQDLPLYKKGVYFHTWGHSTGWHSVKILGYGVENGNKYWLAANSWGETWGDKGFFKIRRGVNECGIEDQVIAGQPIV